MVLFFMINQHFRASRKALCRALKMHGAIGQGALET